MVYGALMQAPKHDPVFDEIVIPWTCPCCTKCWMIVEGKRKGRCVYGGPYKGYVEVERANVFVTVVTGQLPLE